VISGKDKQHTYKASDSVPENYGHKGGREGEVSFDMEQIEQDILCPLNEVLVVAYGTPEYRAILKALEQMVIGLEAQHKPFRRWS
jgi:hypothetical protein